MKNAIVRTLRGAAVAALALTTVFAAANTANAHSSTEMDTMVYNGCEWASGGYRVLESNTIRLPGSTGPEYDGIAVGIVYLVWNEQLGENCVLVRKIGHNHGVSTDVRAWLYVEADPDSGGRWNLYREDGDFSHYAGAAGPARNRCVMYEASVRDPYYRETGWNMMYTPSYCN